MNTFLKEVGQHLLGAFGEDLKDIAIVFNNKRPEVYLRKYLTELAGKPLWSPSFYTIQEFIKNAFAETEADKLQQILLLYDQYNHLLQQRQEDPVAIDRFYPIAEIILSDFSQLDYDLVNPDDLYSQLQDIALIQQKFPHFSDEQLAFMEQFWSTFNTGKRNFIQEKFMELWTILPVLYTRFKQELANQQKHTIAGMYRELAEGKESHPAFVQRFKKIIFIGFNALNKAEVILFKRWQQERKALFYFDVDNYYLNDPLQEAGRFLRRNLEVHELKNALGQPFDLLAQKQDSISLIESNGFIAQAKVLEGLLSDAHSHNDSENSLSAIILADEQLLVPVLQSIPDSLKTNITMGFPITQSPLYGYIDLWLTVQEAYYVNHKNTVHYQEVENFLSHPMISLTEQERLTLQEKLSTRHYLEVPLHLLNLTNDGSLFFKVQENGALLVDGLILLITHTFQQHREKGLLTTIEAAIFVEVFKQLNHLKNSLASVISLTIPFVLSLIRKSLLNISAAIEGDPLSGMQIMGLLETRCLDFKEIYLLATNEGILPKNSMSPTFIPDAIRRVYGLPILENQEALSAYLFYRLLQRAHKITFIYNSQINEKSSGEPSRFIRQLRYESNFHFNVWQQQQTVKSNPPRTVLEITKSGKIGELLNSYLDVTNPLRPGISATGFTTYLQSPLLFFLKYIAKIKEPERIIEDFELNRIGSILHEVMQWFYQELKEENPTITAERIQQQRKRLPDFSLQALSKEFYQDPALLKKEKTNSIEKIILNIVLNYAQIFVQYDSSIAPFTILALENKKDYTIDFPITVNGEEKKVKLYGIIDRIDEIDGKIRIVDYKTGMDELVYSDGESLFDFTSDKNNKALIQTLFYTHIYEKVSGKQHIEPHLYAARKLRKEGSLFYRKGRGTRDMLTGRTLEELKEVFLVKLRHVLEELFNDALPFRHPTDVDIPYAKAYSEFL